MQRYLELEPHLRWAAVVHSGWLESTAAATAATTSTTTAATAAATAPTATAPTASTGARRVDR